MASRCVEDVGGFAAAVAEGGAVERGRIRDEMETGSVVYEKGHRLTLKSSRYISKTVLELEPSETSYGVLAA